ncbi:MAG: GNAT family N-acetyltransferase [Patescibacteria group bacterium]
MITSMQLEEAQTLWMSALLHEAHQYPFMTYAWHAAWQTIGNPAQKVTVYTDGDVVASLVRVGTEVHFSGGEEVADYLDAIGEPDKKPVFWEKLLPYLKTLGVSKLVLRNVRYDSPTKGILVALGGVAEEEDRTPVIRLPATHDAYFASLTRKDRHELKRKIRKFELVYPDTRFSIEEKESIDMDALLALMKRNSEKREFLTAPMETFFQALPTLPGVPIIQANLRTDKGMIIASVLLFPVGSSLLLYNSGYDPSFQGSGFYLKAKTILWAIDKGYKECNFLQGKERYKYELGGQDQPVFRVEMNLK